MWLCSAAMLLPALVAGALVAWMELWSEDHSRHYYFDPETGEASWRLPAGAAVAAPPEPRDELQGWADCTHDAAGLFGGGALQRAYRSIARTAHPDKGGSSEAFQKATA